MRLMTTLVIATTLFMASCSNQAEQENKAKQETTKAAPTSKLNPAGTEKLMMLLSDYYAMKDALVKSDTVAVRNTIALFFTKTSELKTQLSTDSSNDYQTIQSLDSINLNLDAMIKNSTWNIEQQRMAFEQISNNVFKLVKTTELKHAKIYRQYCPMAFNDKGAYWLSSEEAIKNPYFGKKMLECGEVTETIE